MLGSDPTIGTTLGSPGLAIGPGIDLGSHALPDATIGALGASAAGPADVWGRICFPARAPTTRSPGDEAIALYLEFFKAYLQADANVLALWDAAGVAPGQAVVRGLHVHNPSDTHDDKHGAGFNTKDLPALYMWREGGEFEWIADDWMIEKATWTCLWVFTLDMPERQRKRANVANAVAKAIVTAVERGRTPSFVVPGDPDPVAREVGSFVHGFTNVMSINARRWSRAVVTTKIEGDKPAMTFPAVQVTFDVEENLEFDPRIWSDPSGLEQSVAAGSWKTTGRK